MPKWITNNLAPISFFTLVVIAIVGISISNQSTQNKAELLINQAVAAQEDIDKYDGFLLYKYNVKTEDYKSFANDVADLSKKLESSRDNLAPVPTDEEGTQLREDLKLLLNFKIDTYQKISFDLQPYTDILEQSKQIGQFKKLILNTDKLDREKRLVELEKTSQAGKQIMDFYNEKRQGEPKILEKVKYDTGLMTQAYESLKNNPEIDAKLIEEIKTNFGADASGVEQWPAENVPDYTIDQQNLGLNEMQTALSYVRESLKSFEAKYKPERLNNSSLK